MARKLETLTLASLSGCIIDEVHSRYGKPDDTLTICLQGGPRLVVPIDRMVPIGNREWDDYWTDFDDFLEEVPDDLDTVASEGNVATLGEILGSIIGRVRTAVAPSGRGFVILDLNCGFSLLMPAADLQVGGQAVDWPDFQDLLDPEASLSVSESPA